MRGETLEAAEVDDECVHATACAFDCAVVRRTHNTDVVCVVSGCFFLVAQVRGEGKRGTALYFCYCFLFKKVHSKIKKKNTASRMGKCETIRDATWLRCTIDSFVFLKHC